MRQAINYTRSDWSKRNWSCRSSHCVGAAPRVQRPTADRRRAKCTWQVFSYTSQSTLHTLVLRCICGLRKRHFKNCKSKPKHKKIKKGKQRRVPPPASIPTLRQWWGLRGHMILRAMPAVVLLLVGSPMPNKSK
jgi:hypothetical protein